MKVSKVKRPNQPDVEDTAEEIVEEIGAAEETAATPATPAATPPPTAPKITTTASINGTDEKPPKVVASANPPDKKGYLVFSCTRTVEPAPRLGHYDIGLKLKIKKLSVGGQYKLPAHVALTLVDRKIGFVVQPEEPPVQA